MTTDDFLRLPGLAGERGVIQQQIRTWLDHIQAIDHYGHLEQIVNACGKLWQHPRHQHFTTHGLEHSGRIIARLADWLAANRERALEPMEAFLLLGAAYLHDVGMQCVCPSFLQAEGISSTLQQNAAPDYIVLEQIRQKHGSLSQRMIRDACQDGAGRKYAQFSLDATSFPKEAELMGVISRYHAGAVSNVPAKYAIDKPCQEVAPPVRMMLLIHLLRIGDALDADARRLPKSFLETHPWAGIPPKDQFHVLKHFCTASIERQGIGYFVFHYSFPANVGDIKPALQQVAEKSLREHVSDAGRLLNAEGIALTAVDRVTEAEDAVCPYPLTEAVRTEFHASASSAPKIGSRADPTAYLAWLYANTSHIDIRGLSVGSGKAHRFPIEELYIPFTMAGLEREPKPNRSLKGIVEESAHPELQRALRARTLVIVGDPGSGKSTFLNRIAAALCDSWMGREPEAAAIRLGMSDRPLPALIRVVELAGHIAKCQTRGEGPPSDPRSPAWLAHFLGAYGQDWNWNLDEAYFHEHFKGATAVILLDGLDEAPTSAMREQISAMVQRAAADYPHCRFVVTSRPAAYVDKAVLSGFTQARIEPLDDAAVDQFLRKWSVALFHDSSERAKAHYAELVQALHCRLEIRKLARNPVMLTALAVVHWNERRMPERRVDLYESIMKWLARSRERKPGRLPDELALERLAELALAMQDAVGGRKRQVPRRWAAQQIAHHWSYLPEDQRMPAAEQFLVEEELDSGIVMGRGQEALFWHLTFQEYLAACALSAFDSDDLNSRLLHQPQKLYATEWRETVLLLAMEFRKRRNEKATQGVVSSILGGLGTTPSLADEARCVGLVGAILRDLAATRFQPKDLRYAPLLQRVMAIFDSEKSTTVPIEDAIAAAEALGRAGDPRFAHSARTRNWVRIEACEFKPSRGKQPVRLSAYFIGRYPVTVGEYVEFIEAGGYTDERWWTAGGHGEYAQPDAWEEQISHPNRPVVGVSWFEASAYATWRGYRLPTQVEWERAAAGMEHRDYSWGGAAPNARLANYAMQVGAPTPVGIYPCGATPDGIADITGNVWEWCQDSSEEGLKPFRVMRGGSWSSEYPGYLSCSYCSPALTHYRMNYIGFRCVFVGEASGLGNLVSMAPVL